MARKNWTYDELVVAFNLYCRTPFGRIHNRNQEIIELAKAIGRTPSAVSWKLANFSRLDPAITGRSRSGATHGAKLEQEVWDAFNNDWNRLSLESERLRAQFLGNPTLDEEIDYPEGKTRSASVEVRVNQSFFRAAILASYDCKCCITGLSVPELLCASHIVPWSIDSKNRTNPRNGLCLNAIHDRAFDRGLISIGPDFRVRVSGRLKGLGDQAIQSLILTYEGAELRNPNHFRPDPEFLSYHRDVIFRS